MNHNQGSATEGGAERTKEDDDVDGGPAEAEEHKEDGAIRQQGRKEETTEKESEARGRTSNATRVVTIRS